jgi:hypothetical protein
MRTNRVSQNVANKASMSGRELQIALDRLGQGQTSVVTSTGQTVFATTGEDVIQRLTLWGFWPEGNDCPNPDVPTNWADTAGCTHYRIVLVHTDNDAEFDARLQYANTPEGGVFADVDFNTLDVAGAGTLDISDWFELPDACRGEQFAYRLQFNQTAGVDPVEIQEMFIEFKSNLGGLAVQGPAGPSGSTGATGAQGPAGPSGAAGQGVPIGGTADQVLAKVDGTDYNTYWKNDDTGVGGSSVVVELEETFILSDFVGGGGPYEDFATQLPAGAIVILAVLKHSAAFTGGGAAAVTADFGTSSDTNQFISGFDVFSAPSSTNKTAVSGAFVQDHAAATTIRVSLNPDVSPNVLTTGSITAWVYYIVAT